MSVVAPSREWETRHIGSEGRADVGDDKKLRGYPIVFNSVSEDFGGWREVIRPSAVDRTLRQGSDVRAYFDHDPSKVLGRTTAGTLRLKKDTHGLHMENDPDTSQTWIRDLMRSIKRGDITGMSFRFQDLTPAEDRWLEDGDAILRQVTDMRVAEVSVVSEPAYPATAVSFRSLQESLEQFKAERPRRSVKFLGQYLRSKGVR